MSLKKIVATAGLAVGAITIVSDLADQAGVSTLHETDGGVDVIYVPREGPQRPTA